MNKYLMDKKHLTQKKRVGENQPVYIYVCMYTHFYKIFDFINRYA